MTTMKKTGRRFATGCMIASLAMLGSLTGSFAGTAHAATIQDGPPGNPAPGYGIPMPNPNPYELPMPVPVPGGGA
jgi:hypothetical protein